MAAKASNKDGRNAVRRTMDWGARMLQGFKPIEAGLFGLGGYYLGDVLNSTGLPRYLYYRFPQYAEWVNAGYTSGLPNAENTFAAGGGNAIVKVGGLATFVATLAKAAKSGLSAKSLNSALPFSIGAMIDAPEGGQSSSSGARW